MSETADRIAAALRPLAPDSQFASADIPHINALAANFDARRKPAGAPSATLGIATPGISASASVGAPAPATGPLTVRVALELIGHEAIVQEAYKDSVGVWTWGIGVTNASGHNVDRYKDRPQSIRHCIEVYVWLLKERYIPQVLRAFNSEELTEHKFAAALSFHYNTGRIATADWVQSYLAGEDAKARAEFMNFRKPPEIIPRREKERNLFFDGAWSQDGKATVFPVRRPSYAPNWSGAKRVDVSADVAAVLAEAARG